MTRSATTFRRPRPEFCSAVVLCCAIAGLLLTSSGCTTVNKALGKPAAPKQADPILGEVHPQNSQPYGPTPPPKKDTAADPASQKSSALDPLLGPSPTSPAYLASVTKALPGAQTLAISDGKPAPFQLTGALSHSCSRSLRTRRLRTVHGSRRRSVRPRRRPAARSRNSRATSSTLFAPLTSRGITQHRVDPQPDGSTRLIAIAPQPGGNFRTFDVTARDVPSAVQAVVQQIDRP